MSPMAHTNPLRYERRRRARRRIKMSLLSFGKARLALQNDEKKLRQPGGLRQKPIAPSAAVQPLSVGYGVARAGAHPNILNNVPAALRR